MPEYCINCGSKLEKDAAFCTNCGNKTGQYEVLESNINQQQDLQQNVDYTGDFYDIFVKGSLDEIKHTTENIFISNNFRVEWYSDFSGKAKRGSKVGNFAVGSIAQYYEIDFQIYTAPNKDIGIRISRSNIGLLGGAWGVHKVKKQFLSIVDMLTNQFYEMGLFISRKPE